MQLTRFDRWLRRTFVHETHVYSLRPPEFLPPGVRHEELPDIPGRQYHHRFIARSDKAVDALLEQFKQHSQMFTTRVVDRRTWYVPLLAPKDKSVTWWCAWVVISAIGLFVLTSALRALWNNPTFRKNAAEALEILKE
ncbi:MAG: hypothetical protein MUF31_13125 [Akkermansiaceae bacterium]|jgi:hypothetical protein|nr:hypothetical protein [Akkermansiaceae bacterium]